MSCGESDHAGVEPRNRFLPPRAIVSRLRRHTPAGWAAVPPVPALTDTWGEVLIGRAAVRLAYDDQCLHLTAQVAETTVTVKAQLSPDSPKFWTQDHIELRFLRDPGRDLDQVQFIVAPNGRVWDNQGLWSRGAGIRARGWQSPDGWRVSLSVPFAAFGVAVPVAGTVWRGIVAHTRWADGHADIACSSATELGFPQAERFGEFCFNDAPGTVILSGVTPAGVVLLNTGRSVVEGELRMRRERGSESADCRTVSCRLKPGENRVSVTLDLEYPLFTRCGFEFVNQGRMADLGSVSVRTPLPAFSGRPGTHPYLLFDAGGLAAIRSKARRAPFAALVKTVSPTVEDLTGSDLPGPDDPVALDITRGCMNWFRVAKETMLRAAEGKGTPASRRLWDLQSGAAHAAWRALVQSVTPTEEQLGILIPELNRLLARRDFHDADAFAGVHLPEEGRRLIGRGVGTLTNDEVFRLNRILLQSAVECMYNYRMDLAHRPSELWAKWLVTGDSRLIATATKAVRAALTRVIMDHQIHLSEGMAAGSLALAYDTFRPYLSRNDREVWEELLLRFLRLYLETARRHSWTVTTIANANPVGNGGCGLAALALWREYPALAAECLGHARRNIRLWLDYCQGADGGNTEGVQYWQYGVDSFVRFAVALERVTGADDGLLSHPAVRNGMNMIRASLCNDGALHGVNDTIPMPVGSTLAWFLAGRSNDALGLWYGDHALRWMQTRLAEGKPVAYQPGVAEMLLYRPDVPEAKAQPGLPEAFALRSIEYGILRSGPEWNCRWTAGIKGSRPPYTHHNQADTGALFVDLRGERLIIDPGYYKPAPSDHTLPLIEGRGPKQACGWAGTVTACEQRGDCRYMAVDVTAAYAGAATRAIRHLVMAGSEGLVLLDDIAARGRVQAQYQCGGPTRLANKGRSVVVAGTAARLRLDVVSRPDATITLLPERSLHDTHWGYHFADCRLFPVTATYAVDADRPLVTVFLDVTRGAARPGRVERTGDRLDVLLPSGRRVRFVWFRGRWEWAGR